MGGERKFADREGAEIATYFCKIVFADRLQPTKYLDDASVGDLRDAVDRAFEQLTGDENVVGFYVGKAPGDSDDDGPALESSNSPGARQG